MKKNVSILFCLLFSLSLSAHTEKNTNGTSGGSYETESNTEKKLDSGGEAEPAEQTEELDAEPDSSYYSVNKFNFLFYFVYKMKYMDEDTEVQSSED